MMVVNTHTNITQRLSIVFFALLSSLMFLLRPCFADTKEAIMSGSTQDGRVRATLYYITERKTWGFAERYYGIILSNNRTGPFLFHDRQDSYVLITGRNKHYDIEIDAGSYLGFINPGEKGLIRFSQSAAKKLKKLVPDARGLIIRIPRERVEFRLRPIQR